MVDILMMFSVGMGVLLVLFMCVSWDLLCW